jgi:hypothetical protein
MKTFLTQSGLGLTSIALIAGLAYSVLALPAAPAARPAAAEIAAHVRECATCQLPFFGDKTAPSKLGAEPHAVAAVTASTVR